MRINPIQAVPAIRSTANDLVNRKPFLSKEVVSLNRKPVSLGLYNNSGKLT